MEQYEPPASPMQYEQLPQSQYTPRSSPKGAPSSPHKKASPSRNGEYIGGSSHGLPKLAELDELPDQPKSAERKSQKRGSPVKQLPPRSPVLSDQEINDYIMEQSRGSAYEPYEPLADLTGSSGPIEVARYDTTSSRERGKGNPSYPTDSFDLDGNFNTPDRGGNRKGKHAGATKAERKEERARRNAELDRMYAGEPDIVAQDPHGRKKKETHSKKERKNERSPHNKPRKSNEKKKTTKKTKGLHKSAACHTKPAVPVSDRSDQVEPIPIWTESQLKELLSVRDLKGLPVGGSSELIGKARTQQFLNFLREYTLVWNGKGSMHHDYKRIAERTRCLLEFWGEADVFHVPLDPGWKPTKEFVVDFVVKLVHVLHGAEPHRLLDDPKDEKILYGLRINDRYRKVER